MKITLVITVGRIWKYEWGGGKLDVLLNKIQNDEEVPTNVFLFNYPYSIFQ